MAEQSGNFLSGQNCAFQNVAMEAESIWQLSHSLYYKFCLIIDLWS